MRRSERLTWAKMASFCTCIALFAGSCGTSAAGPSSTVPDTVPDGVAFSGNTSGLVASTDSGTDEGEQTPSLATGTCATGDYKVPVPDGWFAASSGDGPCTVFVTVETGLIECDCTVGVTVRSYPGQDAPSRVLDWITFGSVSPTPPLSTSVLGGAATLVTGEWALSGSQTEGIGQYEQRYVYVFADGNNSVEVSAGEFQDWGGDESFDERKAAVDEIAAGLVLK